MAILDLKEKIEPFRKNATGYVKQLLSSDHVVMSDGTTLQTKMDSLNSALDNLKWSDWKTLGTNIGVIIKYRYNAHEVELVYSGTLEKKVIKGGSAGYTFPPLPDGLNPTYNIEHSIYACAGNNTGALTFQCFPTGNPSTFKITSHKTITVEPEYISGYIRYTRY